MSYQRYTVQCQQCGKQMNTAFGVVGTTQIADPVEVCPHCGSGELTKIADGWEAAEWTYNDPKPAAASPEGTT